MRLIYKHYVEPTLNSLGRLLNRKDRRKRSNYYYYHCEIAASYMYNSFRIFGGRRDELLNMKWERMKARRFYH